MKEALKAHLEEVYPSIRVVDAGCHSANSVDYPNIIGNAVAQMKKESITTAIFVCGSGAGVSMAANRYPHLRAILAHDVSTALMSRRHNDSNVLCLGARVIAQERAEVITKIWLTTAFDGNHPEGESHARRVAQLSELGDTTIPQPANACSL